MADTELAEGELRFWGNSEESIVLKLGWGSVVIRSLSTALLQVLGLEQ